MELKDGTVYRVEGNVVITGAVGQSALTVPSKAVAYINVARNAHLTVKGGPGDGKTAAGAGILVEEGAKLYITGDGEVTATGGNAGNGMSGANGTDANYNTASRCELMDAGSKENHGVEGYWGVLGNGVGGAGGNGGGGAGAGVGGAGGAGGNGGTAGETNCHFYGRHNDERYMHSGSNGWAGANGAVGGGMGTVIVTGTVRLRASGGAAGSRGGWSGSHGKWYATKNSGVLNLYTAVGGAGGGLGDGGCAAAGIGGGGGGGGGGGAGGNGGHYLFGWWSDVKGYKGTTTGEGYYTNVYPFVSGTGGNGGLPGTAGEIRPGVENIKYGENGSYKNGNGGNGGTTAGTGGAGSLYVSIRAGIDDKTGLRYGIPPAANSSDIQVKVTFDGKESAGIFTYMGKLPNVMDLNPRRVGYRFAGWWTRPENGNVCFYDRDGVPALPYCDQIDDIELVSKWEVDPSILTVNSTDDGGEFLNAADKTVTLRAAVRALCDNPTLTGTNGARRIVFALPKGSDTIRLKSPIVVPRGVAPFEIFGLCGEGDDLFAVTLTCDKGRILEVNGDGISLSHLMLAGASASAPGGALLCDGSFLMVDDCSFFGNAATEGGAICSRNGFALLKECTFAGNRAKARYGAVSGSGLTAAINCTFSANRVDAPGGMASAALGISGDGLVAHCTFAGNGKSLTAVQVSNVTATVTAVNCIFADGQGAVNDRKKVDLLYSGETNPLDAFVGEGLPLTNKIYGVEHVWYEPRQCDANYDAAMLLYDGYGVGSMITVKGVETNVLFGTAAEANIPILADQLRSVRFAPTRGAIRLLSGENRPGVFLEGFYSEGAGKKPTDATAIVTYDDKVVTSNKVKVVANEYGFFGLNIPVEGSDGTAHNAVTVSVEKLNRPLESMSIATMPYAFTASSSDVLVTGDGAGDDKDVVFPGDAVTANRVVAESVTVSNGWLEVGSQAFSAGTVRGFGSIELAGIDVTEGRLKILQDRNERGVTNRLDYGNLKGMLPKSGEEPFANGSASITQRLTAQANQTVSTDFSGYKATGDGFLQLFVRVPALSGARIGLNVGGLDVTPLGAFGADGRERRFLWTVPVRKGNVAKLTLSAGSAAVSADCLRQYMYFGVQSASELDDVEK